MSFKECKVVMLSTNEKSKLWLNRKPNQLHLDIEYKSNHKEAINHHIYILLDEEIKEGDWILVNEHNEGKNYHIRRVTKETCEDERYLEVLGCNAVLKSVCKKIIATTDKSLTINIKVGGHTDGTNYYLPEPSQSFIQKYIEEYNKGNIITDVLVEYEADMINTPYTSAKQEILIHQIKIET